MRRREANSSVAKPTYGSVRSGIKRFREHRLWLVLAALLAAGGMALSVAAAGSAARTDSAAEAKTFGRSASEVASTLQLAIQHQDDLVVNASAFVNANPGASEASFRAWATSVQVLGRYPEVLGLGLVVIVPAAQLPAFAARARTDPAASLGPDGTFQVVPAGARPYYCLSELALVRQSLSTSPSGTDWCASRPAASANPPPGRDSGLSVYAPVSIGDTPLLSVSVPVYRGGVQPTTLDARRQAFVGWLGTVLVPRVLLNRALQGHSGMSVSMAYDLNGSRAEFSSGSAPQRARSVAIDLGGGWTVRAAGPLEASGLIADPNARGLLMGGAALSLLLGVLVFVLGTGRARALRMVRDSTAELRHQALHDALTGLPNRALILDRIENLLARNRRHGTSGAALFVDLDEFKNVNDTLGHAVGDQLLVSMAARLTDTLREADTIGRMGGDEFVVLIDGAAHEVDPELVARRLLRAIRQPFSLDGAALPLIVNTSIGIAMGDRATAGELLRDADVALYQAKAAGKNCYEVYRPEMQTEIARRIDIEFDLRSAVTSAQFRLVYQPIYNLGDLSIIGVEALLRWEHPKLGTLPPDEFIPILERTGQILEVGRWVLREACRQMARWHARGDTSYLSVNVSGRQLDHDSIVDDVRDALADSGLPAASLVLEVTETALMLNADATAKRLHEVKAFGVRIAVDDFGTGYSSLAYLRQFPVDCLKIDRTFIHAIADSAESKILIGTLVRFGKGLGLNTVAEGVETEGEMDLLRTEQVDEVQGFLFAGPLDPDALEARLLAPGRLEKTGAGWV